MTTRGADYERREHDDYPTPPEVLDVLFRQVGFEGAILDPACGKLCRVIKAAERHGYTASGNDIIHGPDFLNISRVGGDNIVTNPPYGGRTGKLALRFIEHALKLTARSKKRVAMLLPIDFDSGKTRAHVFAPPVFALKLVLLDRVKWFDNRAGSTNHAWYVWDWKHRGPATLMYARTASADMG